MVVKNTGKIQGYRFIDSVKRCSICGEVKSRLEFTIRSNGQFAAECKQCNVARTSARYYSDPVIRQAQAKRSSEWAKANPEKRKLSTDKYAKEKADRCRASVKAWSQKNKAYHRLLIAEWRRANPDACRSHANNRLARVKNNGGSYTAAQWIAVKAMYEHTCLACGKKEPDIKLTVDHVLPLAKGGSSDISNLQPLCLSCNCSKQDRHIDYRPAWDERLSA